MLTILVFSTKHRTFHCIILSEVHSKITGLNDWQY